MRLICVLSVAFALGATPALADDEPKYEAQLVPECKVYKADGKEICGYTLEEWKAVLEVDRKMVLDKKLLEDEKKRTAALGLQVDSLKEQVAIYASNQETLVDRNTQLTKDLIDTDKKYQNERVKPRWGSPLAWTVAAVSTSVLAGIVVKEVLD